MTGELDGFVSFIHALDWLNLKGPDKPRACPPVARWTVRRPDSGRARKRKAPEAYRGKARRGGSRGLHSQSGSAARALIERGTLPQLANQLPRRLGAIGRARAAKAWLRRGGRQPAVGPNQAATDRMVCRSAARISRSRASAHPIARPDDQAKLKTAIATRCWNDFTKRLSNEPIDTAARRKRKSGHYPLLLSRGDIEPQLASSSNARTRW